MKKVQYNLSCSRPPASPQKARRTGGKAGRYALGLFALFSLLFAGSLASAQSISVNFIGGNGNNPQPTPMDPGEVAGVTPLANWNNMVPATGGAVSTGPTAVVDSNGNPTSVTVDVEGATNTWSSGIADTPGNYRMMNGFLDDNTDPSHTQVIVDGLDNTKTYAVYIYAGGDNGSPDARYGSYTIGSQTFYNHSSQFKGTFIKSSSTDINNPSTGNYMLFAVSNQTGFTLDAFEINFRAPVSGIQIVPVSGPPAVPTGLVAVTGSNRVGLYWNAAANAFNYNVLRSETSGSGYTSIATGVGDTTYQDATALNGHTYYYVVQAVNPLSASANSNQASASPLAGLDGTGLTGEYHSGDNGGAPPFNPATTLFTNVGEVPNFDFINGPKPANAPAGQWNNFSVRWTGLVKAQVSGPYVFTTASDDGSRIWLDGCLIVDNYFYQGVVARSSAPINLTAGSLHTIRVQFFQGGGGAAEYLSWAYPGQSTQIIPAYALFPTYGATAPPAPMLSGVPGAQSATLVWCQPESATTYTLKRATVSGGPYTTVATGIAPSAVVANINNANTDSYTDTGLSNGVTYYYVVMANNAGGSSANSNEVAVTPVPPTIGNGTGLAGLWYAPGSTDFSAELNAPIYYEIDPTVNFNGGGNTTGYGATAWPAGFITANGGSSNQFTAVWTGQVLAPYTGSYQFQTITDDGARFSIDIKDGNGLTLQFDDQTGHGPLANTGAAVSLTAGQKYDIKFEMFNGTGGYTAQLLYNPLGLGFQIIPQTQLFPTFPQAPDPITNLSALGGFQSVTLYWTAPFYGADYIVLRSLTAGGPYTQIATDVTALTYTDTGLTNGVTYYYVVKAHNPVGTSANSNEAPATPVAPVIGNGDGLYGTYYNGDDTGFAAESNPPFLFALSPTINYTVDNPVPGSPGPWPAGVPHDHYTVKWTGQLLAPFTTDYTFETVADDGIRVTLDGNVIIDDGVYQGPTEAFSGAVSLTAGTKHDIIVEFFQGGGGATAQLFYSIHGSPYSIIPQTQLYSAITVAPDAPTNLVAVPHNQSARLYWLEGANATSYTIKRSLTAGGPYTAIASGVTVPTYVDNGLTNGVTYYYVVVGVNNIGSSAASNEASATPTAGVSTIAYWRFEDGANGAALTTGATVADVSNHNNTLSTPDDGAAPTYRSNNPGATGNPAAANALSFDFSLPPANNYVARELNTGAATGDINAHEFPNGITIEASIYLLTIGGYQSFVTREGQNFPGDPTPANGDLYFQCPDPGNTGGNQVASIRLHQPDGTFVICNGSTVLEALHWYNFAAVADGFSLSLYLQSAPGGAYNLENQVPCIGVPTFQGSNWVVGRGYYNGAPTDRFFGSVDEVRISDNALDPSLFLFAPSAGATVSGRIALEGVNSLTALSAGAPLGTFHVSFRTPNTTTEVFGADVTLTPVGAGNPNGTFTISGVPAGTYDVAIKGNKSLRVVLPSVIVSGATTLSDVTLPAGDADNNNIVDIGDFGVLVNAYLGDFNDPTSGYDPKADFNYDGKDDIGDFGLLVNEFGTPGAP